jgi:hypothetical protein
LARVLDRKANGREHRTNGQSVLEEEKVRVYAQGAAMSKFTDLVQHNLNQSTKALEEWSESPLGWWKLSGCDSVFEHAQRIHIAQDVLRSLADAEKKGQDEKRRIAFLYRHYEKQHRNKAAYPKRSTSVTSNLADQCELAAIAEMLNLIDKFRNGTV